ncbi:MAG: GNAT family N-acetyltransferase [Candidatus Latescibacterota bacterium]
MNRPAPSIRPAAPADAAGCLEIYAPVVRDTIISFETEVPSLEEFTRRIEDTTADYPWLVFETGGRVAAYAYARRHRERAAYRWCVEVSVFVAREHHRRGIGRRLYNELLDILTRQGIANAYAGIAQPNPASVAFHEAMGFEPVGVYRRVGYKLGAWRDVGWWARRLSARDEPPSEPIPFPELDV